MNEAMVGHKALWGRRGVLYGALMAAFVAAGLAGCGGGGGSSSGASGIETPAAAYTTGPVSGFGSIIVNGVRFDDSSADIEDEDGARRSSNDIKLGVVVEIESDEVDDSTGRARALHIRFGSEIVGPVDAVDLVNNSFSVLDQVVEVRTNTVFDDSLAGDLAGLAGQTVEVHALFDAVTGHYVATRVEARADAAFYKLRGLVSQLDTRTRSFQIGDAVISYLNVADADLPSGLADGMRVRVRLAKVQVAGEWLAVTVRSGVRKVEDHADARIRGTVTAYTSDTRFEVNGIPVDARGARSVPNHKSLGLGARVDVRGTVVDGTLVATRVKVLREEDDEVCGVELHGGISEVDLTTNSFMLRGVKVSFPDGVEFKDGSLAQLLEGAQVEVKGVLSHDRSSLVATLIEFED